MRRRLFYLFVLMAATYCAVGAAAGESSPGRRIDASVQDWLATSGAPSASIAVIQNGALTYAHAYGRAQLSPSTAATTSTRYAVDSISKEFTAAAVLLLVPQGKLSLDDRVEKWFPDLGDASKVTSPFRAFAATWMLPLVHRGIPKCQKGSAQAAAGTIWWAIQDPNLT